MGLAFRRLHREAVKWPVIHASTLVRRHGRGGVLSRNIIQSQFLRKCETDACAGVGAGEIRALRGLPKQYVRSILGILSTASYTERVGPGIFRPISMPSGQKGGY